MNGKKLFALAGGILLAAVLIFVFSNYTLVGFQLYPRDAQELDLRGQALSLEEYEKLAEKMPDAEIRFDVPFQGSQISSETTEITVTNLTMEDAGILAACLPKLRTVSAESCTDYEALLHLKQQRPEVQVNYRVKLSGRNYASTTIRLTLSGITEEELARLEYLPFLKTVTLTGGQPELLTKLQEYCREKEISLRLQIGGDVIPENTESLELTGITTESLSLLYLMPRLKTLHLIEPEAEAEALLALSEALADTSVTWEKTVFGLTFPQDAQLVDLTEVTSLGPNQTLGAKTAYQYGLDYPVLHTEEEVRSAVKVLDGHPLPDKSADTAALIAEAEAAMAYFPEAEKLVMCGCILDNKAMAAFREAHREDYKVVWSVDCGEIAPRTDAAFFMPVKYHVYYLSTEQAYNLRYCEDMIAVDIGHMNVSDISFAEFMPNLEYLILAHTSIQSIEALKHCTKLKFLEVDHTAVQDLTPLQNCTLLEDLNIGNTWCKVDPLKEMTWLKNLWMIFRGNRAAELMESLPDTNIVYAGSATVDSGWRDLPNYFAMRDALQMYYMTW